MPRPDFSGLRSQLIRRGVAPRHINRTLLELEDHFDDLKDEALQQGYLGASAQQLAATWLGDVDLLAQEVAARPELKTWLYRYPKFARLVLPLAYLVLLPTVPIFIGVSRASAIARWSASMMLGAAITATIFLVLQISIAIS